MKDDSEDMTFKVLRGLTFEEALEVVSDIDIKDIKDNLCAIAQRLDPILQKYNWSVDKMLTHYAINKEKYELSSKGD